MSRNTVLQHIDKYGFQVEQLDNSPIEIYRCTNQLSKDQFILVCINDNLAIPETNIILEKVNHKQPIKVVYLIYINGNIEQIIQLVQAEENQNKIFLIFDEEDEMEFFLKDLWNIIIDLNS